MMYWFEKWIIWIYRWRHCRGFGVQSPSDYSFIRYVINEHYPYYAYAELMDRLGDIGKLKRKKAELLFRIANWIQSPSIALLIKDDNYHIYMHEGCRSSIIRNQYDGDKYVIVSSFDKDECLFLMNNMRDGCLLVIDDLNNWKARQLWKKIVADKRATITFDLYYLGIVMVVDKRYKINYKVNF